MRATTRAHQVWTLVLLCVLLGSRGGRAEPAQSTPPPEGQAEWPSYIESEANFSFACPADWKYEGGSLAGLFTVTAPDGLPGSGGLFLTIAVEPAEGIPPSTLVERLVAAPPSAAQEGAIYRWQGWRDTPGGLAYERSWSQKFPWDDSRYLTVCRYLPVGDNVLVAVATLSEPVDDQQVALIHAVFDTLGPAPSLYDQLQLSR